MTEHLNGSDRLVYVCRLGSGIAELTRENRHLAMHGLGSLIRSAQGKPAERPTWTRNNGTLESVVHQCNQSARTTKNAELQGFVGRHNSKNMSLVAGLTSGISSDELFAEEKWRWQEHRNERNHVTNYSASDSEKLHSCWENSAGMLEEEMKTWTSPDRTEVPPEKGEFSSKSMKEDENPGQMGTKKRNHEEETNKGEAVSLSTKRSRAADVHNQLERRRRDRINQKMRALQKLVPNSSKTDKASMLDAVIGYLKQLQAQVRMMSQMRVMPHMMMPMAMQQHLHVPLMAQMGMGMGMGMPMPMPMPMMDMHAGSVGLPPIPPLMHPAAALVLPTTLMPTPSSANHDQCAPNPPSDSYYSGLLAQSMNLHYYNKMALIYQQLQQSANSNSSTQGSHMQSSGI